MKLLIMLLGTCLLAFSSQAEGDNVQHLEELSKIDKLKACAERSEISCQSYLGSLYFEGLFVEQDYKKSFKWHMSAARQGFAPDQKRVANMLSLGQGVAKNSTYACVWHLVAANAGFNWTVEKCIEYKYIEPEETKAVLSQAKELYEKHGSFK